MNINHWKGTRDFALFDDDQSLIAVFVYRKGAERVKAMIEAYRDFLAKDKTGEGVKQTETENTWVCQVNN